MQVLVKNKRAFFDYQIEKEYLAGIVLRGFEVKALKTSHSNMDIPLYEKTSPVLAPNYQSK